MGGERGNGEGLKTALEGFFFLQKGHEFLLEADHGVFGFGHHCAGGQGFAFSESLVDCDQLREQVAGTRHRGPQKGQQDCTTNGALHTPRVGKNPPDGAGGSPQSWGREGRGDVGAKFLNGTVGPGFGGLG